MLCAPICNYPLSPLSLEVYCSILYYTLFYATLVYSPILAAWPAPPTQGSPAPAACPAGGSSLHPEGTHLGRSEHDHESRGSKYQYNKDSRILYRDLLPWFGPGTHYLRLWTLWEYDFEVYIEVHDTVVLRGTWDYGTTIIVMIIRRP